MPMGSLFAQAIDGLGLAVILALLAVAYRISGGVARLPVFTIAGCFLIGAAGSKAAIWTSGWIVPETVALVLALVAAVGSGLVCGRIIHFLRDCADDGTAGLSLIFSLGLLLTTAGLLELAGGLALPRYLDQEFAPHALFAIGGMLTIVVPVLPLAVIVPGILAIAAVLHVNRATDFGIKAHAIAQDRQSAELLGIDVARVELLTALVTGALAALAGWMTSIVEKPADVDGWVLIAATAAVSAAIGRVHSLWSAAVWGGLAGIASVLWSLSIGPRYSGMAVFLGLLFVLIIVRPIFTGEPTAEQA